MIDRARDPDSPLVSFIIATYRGDDPAYLRTAVESALAQTYPHIEVVIVVDGQIAESTKLYLHSLEHSGPRVRLIWRPTNDGPAKARNDAVARARGEYIAILDADDAAAPERIERQLAYLREHGADLVGADYERIDARGRVLDRRRAPHTERSVRGAMALFNPICHSTVFAKAELLKRRPYPDWFPSARETFGEDYALWVELAREGRVLLNVPECLGQFRVNDSFLARRRGRHVFASDLRTKRRALALYPAWSRPLVALAALVVSALRLMPAPVARAAYWLRKRASFTRS